MKFLMLLPATVRDQLLSSNVLGGFNFYFADNYLNFIWHTSSDKARFSAIHS